MLTTSFIEKQIRSRYAYLNEEQFGVIQLVLIFAIILFGVLSGWALIGFFLNIPELLILDGIGSIVCLVLFFMIIRFGLIYQWSRLIIAIVAITVACAPVLFYGIDTLFTLNLIIIQMSSMLLFTRHEKKVMVKYLICYLVVILVLFFYDYFYGPYYVLSTDKFEILNVLLLGGGVGISFYFSYVFFSENNINKDRIHEEREKSDQLLLRIFPKTIAEQLRESNDSIAEKFDQVTVIFIDLVGFTNLSSKINPNKLVELLDDIFSVFDEITGRYKIEKYFGLDQNFMP